MEKFNIIVKHFRYIEYWHGFENEVDRVIGVWDGLYMDELLTPFKLELNEILLPLNSDKQVSYLKVLLSYAPLYYSNENCDEERKYIKDHITGIKSQIGYNLRENYIVFTFELWQEVLKIIKESCTFFDIQFVECPNIQGMNVIAFRKESKLLEDNPESIDTSLNPHPKIFKNAAAYQMFAELKELTVSQNLIADYSFIYHKLIDRKLGAIHNTVTHPIFIEFLNKEYKTDISVTKLPFKDQKNKQPAYTATLNKYESKIVM